MEKIERTNHRILVQDGYDGVPKENEREVISDAPIHMESQNHLYDDERILFHSSK